MNLKKYLKRFSIFYKINEIIQGIQVVLKKVTLRFSRKETIKIYKDDVNHSISIISAYRKESPQQNFCDNGNIKENDDIDISIIVPIYNAEKYLKECLLSLQSQKTKYKFQVVCIDDGSTDNSANILSTFSTDEHFIIIKQKNMGHSGARNKGLSIPMGRYIMFVDSDDFISNDYINNMVNTAKATNSDIILSNYFKCNASSEILRKYRYKPGTYTDFMDYINFDGVPWGKIYKRELWDKVIYPEGIAFEDTIICNIIFRRCNSITVCENANYFYRIHGNNTIDNLQNNNKLLDSFWSIKISLEMAEALGIQCSIGYFTFFLLQCSTHLYYRIAKYPDNVKTAVFNVVAEMVKKLFKQLDIRQIEYNDIVLKKLLNSFNTHDFGLWEKCSKVYPSNNIKIKKKYYEIR